MYISGTGANLVKVWHRCHSKHDTGAKVWKCLALVPFENLAPALVTFRKLAPVPIWQRCGTGAIQNLAPVPKFENAWHRCHLENWHWCQFGKGVAPVPFKIWHRCQVWKCLAPVPFEKLAPGTMVSPNFLAPRCQNNFLLLLQKPAIRCRAARHCHIWNVTSASTRWLYWFHPKLPPTFYKKIAPMPLSIVNGTLVCCASPVGKHCVTVNCNVCYWSVQNLSDDIDKVAANFSGTLFRCFWKIKKT